MRWTTAILGTVMMGGLLAGSPVPAAAQVTGTTQAAAALRDLWVGHIFWVRGVVVATLAGNDAAAEAAEAQVVANAKQIAAAIEPYYGEPASEQLFGLLAEHYGAVKQYLDATADGLEAAKGPAVESLNRNAGDIARFLSGANPHLGFDLVNALMLAHGAHHLTQIQQLHASEYASEAETWEAMKGHMYMISDALVEAIAKQFPSKFN